MSRILVDRSVLVAARTFGQPYHRVARRWMEDLWKERRGVISASTLLSFAIGDELGEERRMHDVQALLAWNPLPLDGPLLRDAVALASRNGILFEQALRYVEARRLGAMYYLGTGRGHSPGFDELVGIDFRVPRMRPVSPAPGGGLPAPG